MYLNSFHNRGLDKLFSINELVLGRQYHNEEQSRAWYSVMLWHVYTLWSNSTKIVHIFIPLHT